MADRGQSEALGYALVFAIVAASVGLVAATGLAGLEETATTASVDSATTAFRTFADDADDLARGAPARSTAVALSGGHLRVGEPVTVTVSGHRVGAPGDNFSYDVELRPVVYAAGDERVVFAAGAVFRAGGGGAVAIEGPPIRLSANGSTVTLLQTRSRGVHSVGGDTTARITAWRSDAAVLRRNVTAYDLTVRVESPRAGAWERLLSAGDATCSRPAPGVASCSVTTDRLSVGLVRIDVALR